LFSIATSFVGVEIDLGGPIGCVEWWTVSNSQEATNRAREGGPA